jgi:PPOX class probable FMN-dependent enzyme
MKSNTHELNTITAVREIVGEPHPAVPFKLMDALDEMSIAFIRRSPFLVLGTAGADGLPDVSPRGGEPGFVVVENRTTLLIPDRKGNRLIFGLQNILANPKIAAIFFVPGTEETLRIHGRAVLVAESGILQQLTWRGQPALLAIRVEVDRCFFQCGKAVIRSKIWDPATWPLRQPVSFGKQMAPRLGGGDDLAKQIDEQVESDYNDHRKDRASSGRAR